MKKINPDPPCHECDARCCRYVATEIDRPSCKRDYDNIRWYLKHEGVYVFKGHDGAWYMEFKAACAELGKDGRCRDYANRPRMCREHGEGNIECEFVASGEPHVLCFATPGEFEEYLDGKGVDWRWKRGG